MKTILSTLAAVALLAGAANAATFDSFNDPSQALPRSQSYEQALPAPVLTIIARRCRAA